MKFSNIYTYINVILQVPEIPKKKVPEEKRPVPRKEEVPPPKGIASCLAKAIVHHVMLQGKDDLWALWCVKSVGGTGSALGFSRRATEL